MRFLTLVLLVALATPAFATNPSSDCPGNSCHNDSNATGGNAAATAIGGDVRNTNTNTAVGQGGSAVGIGGDARSTSGAKSDATGVGVGVSGAQSDNAVTITSDSKAVFAAPAGDARGESGPDSSVCGDVSGVSAQGGLFGGGFAHTSFACMVHRHLLFQEKHGDAPSAKVESFSFWFPPFLAARLLLSWF